MQVYVMLALENVSTDPCQNCGSCINQKYEILEKTNLVKCTLETS